MAGTSDKISRFLFWQSRKTSILLGAVSLAVIGLCDYATGAELLITVFYLIPISIYAWAVGMRAGIAMAVISELTETSADQIERLLHMKIYPAANFVYTWNVAGKILFFVIFAFVVSKMRVFFEEQQKLIEELRDREAKLASAYKDLEMFSSAVSHDLRSPLIPIEGFARVLLKDYAGKLDDRATDLLTRIGDNAKKMSRLIHDLLSFCRVRDKDVQKVEIDMEALAGEVFEQVRPCGGERDIKLKVCPLPAAYGDSAAIRQVLTNLLLNAFKFTRTAEAAAIEVGGYTKQNDNIYYVRDNGIGFDMQFADRLFGFFQRLHAAKEFEGTGIGLASVKKIVEKHGGRVWAEGKPGEGAVFYFSLPKRAV